MSRRHAGTAVKPMTAAVRSVREPVRRAVALRRVQRVIRILSEKP